MIERRLQDAAEEIRNYSQYDYVLVNREVAGVGGYAGVDRQGPRAAGATGWNSRSVRFWRLLKMA